MREHIKAFLLASSLAFGIPTFVESEPPESAVGGAHDMRAMRWLRKLDLTESQREQIFRILQREAPATRERRDAGPGRRGPVPRAAREAHSVAIAMKALRDFTFG